MKLNEEKQKKKEKKPMTGKKKKKKSNATNLTRARQSLQILAVTIFAAAENGFTFLQKITKIGLQT